MKSFRYPYRLRMVMASGLILGLAALPEPSCAQVGIDSMRELGYEVTNLGPAEVNGESCWELQLDSVPGIDMPFPKIIMLVRQSDNYPLQVDYYDDLGEKLKTLRMQSIERENGVPTAMRMSMKNHLDGTETNFDLTINYEE